MKIKEPVNALTHFAMFLAGLAGLVLLVWKAWGRCRECLQAWFSV